MLTKRNSTMHTCTPFFETLHQQGKTRHGKLHFDKSTVETPCYLVHTCKGAVPNLMPDVLQQVIGLTDASCILNVCFWDIFDSIRVETVQQFQQHVQKHSSTPVPTPLHSLVNTGYQVFISLRNGQFPHKTTGAAEHTISGDCDTGRHKVEVEAFAHAIRIYNPDMFMAMSDQVFDFDQSPLFTCPSEPQTVPQKPVKKYGKAVDRTNKWLSRQCDLLHDFLARRKMFANLTGGPFPQLRQSVASAIDQHKSNIGGYYLGDLGVYPQESFRFELLNALIQLADESKPRIVSGQDTPICILECVERGVDMFDGAYPFILAEHAFASVFPLDMGDGNCEMKMNLRDAKYAKDKSPIVEQCKCYCCTTYSRAYIHHLFDAHEMLGEICLTIHNLHHYLKFFKVIRQHIASSNFATFKQQFLERTRNATQ